jgi:hypothetical protein
MVVKGFFQAFYRMNIIVYFYKKANPGKIGLAHSIGSGYPLIGCSSAEPFSVYLTLKYSNQTNN